MDYPTIVRVRTSMPRTDAAKWYWNIVKENYVSKGFDAFWADGPRDARDRPPFMRGLFMDFGDDPKVANIGDEYMF
jgi:alpha-D-xyloside xylohydrolase